MSGYIPPDRMWVEKMGLPGRIDDDDHPLAKTMYGAFEMPVVHLKELLDSSKPKLGEIHSFVGRGWSYRDFGRRTRSFRKEWAIV